MGGLYDIYKVIELISKVSYRTAHGFYRSVVPPSWLHHKSVVGEVILITGSGSGLGRTMAIKLALHGAKLVLWDMNETLNEETKRLVDAEGRYDARCYTVNIGDREEVNRAAQQVLKDYGRLDMIINNAGIVSGKKFLECSDDLMERTMAVNTHALFYIAKAFVPGMIERDHGHIITIASMAGKIGVAGMVDYCASKFAAVGFSEALRAELRQHSENLNVTLVCPYYINTGMFEGVRSSSPTFLPILETEDAANRIISAILTDSVVYQMPRFCYVSTLLKEIFPSRAGEALAEFFGVNREMDTFTGREVNSSS